MTAKPQAFSGDLSPVKLYVDMCLNCEADCHSIVDPDSGSGAPHTSYTQSVEVIQASLASDVLSSTLQASFSPAIWENASPLVFNPYPPHNIEPDLFGPDHKITRAWALLLANRLSADDIQMIEDAYSFAIKVAQAASPRIHNTPTGTSITRAYLGDNEYTGLVNGVIDNIPLEATSRGMKVNKPFVFADITKHLRIDQKYKNGFTLKLMSNPALRALALDMIKPKGERPDVKAVRQRLKLSPQRMRHWCDQYNKSTKEGRAVKAMFA